MYRQSKFTSHGNLSVYPKKERLVDGIFDNYRLRDEALTKDWLRTLTVDELKFLRDAPIGRNLQYKTCKEFFEKMLRPFQKVRITVSREVKEMVEEYARIENEYPAAIVDRLIRDGYTRWKDRRS